AADPVAGGDLPVLRPVVDDAHPAVVRGHGRLGVGGRDPRRRCGERGDQEQDRGVAHRAWNPLVVRSGQLSVKMTGRSVALFSTFVSPGSGSTRTRSFDGTANLIPSPFSRRAVMRPKRTSARPPERRR